MSRIPINEIVGGSVLDIMRRAGGRINEFKLGNGTPLIEAAIMQDVFYVPSALARGPERANRCRSLHADGSGIGRFYPGICPPRTTKEGAYGAAGFRRHDR